MNRSISLCASLCALAVAATGCGGDGGPPGLTYTDPPAGGALRLVKNARSSQKAIVLDLVVGDTALTGYATGLDLPLDASKVALGPFTPGTALDPGSGPIAAGAKIPSEGPLRGVLVVGLSQKATGTGAVATDRALPPNTVLLTIELDAVEPAQGGVVFDGTAQGFVLPSGGLRNRAGMTVVDAAQVKIGKLESHGN